MPVLDDLTERLDRAAGPAPDPEPVLARIAPRLDRPPVRGRRLLAVAAVVVVLCGGWLALRPAPEADPVVRSGPATTTEAPATTSTSPPTTPPVMLPPRAGYLTVADQDGAMVGYLRDDSPDLDPLPTFALGTGAPLSGQRVVDAQDRPVGYLLVGLGFVSDEQAADPAEVDRLVAEHEELQRRGREYQAEHPDEFPTLPGG